MLTPTAAQVHRGPLILVNADYPVGEDCRADALIPITSAEAAVALCNPAAALLQLVMARLRCAGRVTAVSGFRSWREQARIYRGSLDENGAAFTGQYVALPGHSEHQTGYAIDMARAGPDINPLTPDFPYSGICQQFRTAASRYGFIERYPEGKESVTRIGHEPWHFRYVGAPHAAVIRRLGLTLEEYIDLLRDYPFPARPLRCYDGGAACEIGFVPVGETIDIDSDTPVQISGNNVDGFVVTRWRHPAAH